MSHSYILYFVELAFILTVCANNHEGKEKRTQTDHSSKMVEVEHNYTAAEVALDPLNITDEIEDHNITTENPIPIQLPFFNKSLCKFNRPCVMKCCPLQEMILKGGCSSSSEIAANWSVDLYHHELRDIEEIVLQYSFPMNPVPNATCFVHWKKDFRINADGSILFHNWNEVYDHRSYCVDRQISAETGELEQFAAICYRPRQLSAFAKISRRIQIGGHILSCVCLIIILILHFPASSHKNLHDKSFVCLCATLLLGFIVLILNMLPEVVADIGYGACISLALLSQYFLLSFYFWLAIRCYETLRIMRGSLNGIPMSKLKVSDNRRFLKYNLLSFGVPLVISSVTAIIQHLPDRMVLPQLRPNIGNGRCWIEEKIWALALYYYGHQILLHALSVLFIGSSGYLLYKEGAAFQCCNSQNTPSKLRVHNRPNLQLFWQQFYITMLYVILWAFDSISLVYSTENFWRFFDILNSLQGLFLLLILMKCSPKRTLLQSSYTKMTETAKTLSLRFKQKATFKLTPPYSVNAMDSGVQSSL